MRRFVIFALFFALCSVPALAAPGPVEIEDQKPLFIYIGPAGDNGYNYMHEQGRLYMVQKNPGIASDVAESVPVGPGFDRAVEAAIASGTRVVFANSFGYMNHVIKAARKHPGVYFMHCSGYKSTPNAGTYFGRMYQPRYLSGITAGAATKSGMVGFVAAYPIPEVIRGINAFTLGVRKANPKAVVKVVWTLSWYDKAKEQKAVKTLREAKCDVVGMHTDSGVVAQEAEKLGMWVVGYNCPMGRYAPTRHLVTAVWNWGAYYDETVKMIAAGQWKPERVWWSMKDGMVGLSDYGRAVTPATIKLVEGEKQRILSGRWDVFTGPIKDQSGKIMLSEGRQMSDGDMLTMKWFVEGVDGAIPR